MQKENEKLAKKLKKKEMERIISLVTRAKQFDPRVLQDKENKRLVKEQKLKDKEEEKKRKELEEQQAVEFEILQKENSKLNKIEKEKQRKLDSKARSVTKKLLRAFAIRCKTLTNNAKPQISEYGCFTYDDIEVNLCGGCPADELNNVVNMWMGGEPATKEGSTFITDLTDEQCEADEVLGKYCGAYGRCVDCLEDNHCKPGDMCNDFGSCVSVEGFDYKSLELRSLPSASDSKK